MGQHEEKTICTEVPKVNFSPFSLRFKYTYLTENIFLATEYSPILNGSNIFKTFVRNVQFFNCANICFFLKVQMICFTLSH